MGEWSLTVIAKSVEQKLDDVIESLVEDLEALGHKVTKVRLNTDEGETDVTPQKPEPAEPAPTKVANPIPSPVEGDEPTPTPPTTTDTPTVEAPVNVVAPDPPVVSPDTPVEQVPDPPAPQ